MRGTTRITRATPGWEEQGAMDAQDHDRMRSVATAMSAARMGIGVSALLAPGLASRVLGFPRQHDNPTSRLVGRLFAVREIALGAYTAAHVQNDPVRPELYLLNAAVDGGDAVACTLSLLGRRGVGRAAAGSLALAVPFAATFLWLRGSCQS
jgi:hypothetical protein